MSQRKIKEKRKAAKSDKQNIIDVLKNRAIITILVLKRNVDKILINLPYILIVLFSIYPPTDRDFGWHFKYGEYFFTNWKLLHKDMYSWTLSGYEWVNHSWAYDLLLFQITEKLGYLGLTVLSGILGLFLFYIITLPFNLSFWKKGIAAFFFIHLEQVGIEQGIRSQFISLIFFALLITILIRAQRQVSQLKYTIPLFLIWANFHADFVFGLIITGLFISVYTIQEYLGKKENLYKIFWNHAKYLSIAILVCFINPYTYRIFSETPRHLGNGYLKNVLEWEPIYDACGSCHVYIFTLYSVILFFLIGYNFYKKRTHLIPFAILSLLFLWETYQTRRFEPVFFVITFPTLLSSLEDIRFQLDKFKATSLLFFLISIMLIEYNVVNRFHAAHVYDFSENYYCQFTGCSLAFIDYAKEHPPEGKGLNFYDWGGYLIGKDFPSKLFIDGRMHVWSKDGYQPFGDYIEMYYNTNAKLFNAYDFDWLLVTDDSPIAQKIMTTKEFGVWKLEFKNANTDYFTRVRSEQ